jgi:hypothetical protein
MPSISQQNHKTSLPVTRASKCLELKTDVLAVKDLPLGQKGGLMMFLASCRAEYLMRLEAGRISLSRKDGLQHDRWTLLYRGSASLPQDWLSMREALRASETKR